MGKESLIDRFWSWLAWKLPRGLVYKCALRVMEHAITGKYNTTMFSEVTAMESLERWHEKE